MAWLSIPLLLVIANIARDAQCLPYQEPTSIVATTPAQIAEPTLIPDPYNDEDDLRKRQFNWCYADLTSSCAPSSLAEPTYSDGPTYSEGPFPAPTFSDPAVFSSPGLHYPSPTPNDSNFADSSSGSRRTKTKVSKGVIAGAVVGGILFLSLISSILIFCGCKKRKNTRAGGAGGAYTQPMIVYPPPSQLSDPGQNASLGYGERFGQKSEQKGFASPRVSMLSVQTPPLRQHGEPTQQSPLMGSSPGPTQTTEYRGYQFEEPQYHQSYEQEQPQQPQAYYDAPTMPSPPLINAPMPMRNPYPNMGFPPPYVPPRPYTGT